jgi:hypothetical protein
MKDVQATLAVGARAVVALARSAAVHARAVVGAVVHRFRARHRSVVRADHK